MKTTLPTHKMSSPKATTTSPLHESTRQEYKGRWKEGGNEQEQSNDCFLSLSNENIFPGLTETLARLLPCCPLRVMWWICFHRTDVLVADLATTFCHLQGSPTIYGLYNTNDYNDCFHFLEMSDSRH